jgi:diguanylate cyclase (GGDEF)-like protein
VKDLRGQQKVLAARTRELSLLSQLDPLTGLSNRRAYDSVAPVEIDRCLRRGRTATLLVVDIDHFKQVNDTYGHGFGDSVIRMLGATIANSVRSTDYAFRYGGEEFVVLLPGLDRTMGLEVADRIMREFTNCSPSTPDGTRPFFSVSIGLAQLRQGDDVQALFGRADAAMYRAKQDGRCRTVVAEDMPDLSPAAQPSVALAQH